MFSTNKHDCVDAMFFLEVLATIVFLIPEMISSSSPLLSRDPHLVNRVKPLFNIVGTGDHSFERRLRLGGPLLKDNIATMVLER